jgi:hypothetical protein
VRTIGAPTRELLVWVGRCPRTYAEAMDAWGSHCPRFTVWEDALTAGLVEVDERPGVAIRNARVRLTTLGIAGLPD